MDSGGISINNTFFTLDTLEKDCWKQLANGSLKNQRAFHLAGAATVCGNEVSLRTVVIRKVLPQEKRLRFHTDIRSGKWQELQQNNAISLLFYDAASKVQLRIKGRAMLHYNDAVWQEAWHRTQLHSRRCYLSGEAPSGFSDRPTAGFDAVFETRNPDEAESEAGRVNFGVVSVQALSLDWLWLNHAGHRRAFFDYEQHISTWMVP